MAEVKTLKISRRITFATAVLSWVFFFVVPVLLLNVSLNYLFSLTLQSERRAAMNSMLSEMGIFRKDVEITSYLERNLQKFFSEHGGQIDFSNPEQMAQKIAESAGIKVSGVVCHSADTVEINHHFNASLAERIVGFSKTLMRRYLVAVNQQETREFISEDGRKSTAGIFRFADREKLLRDSEGFFRLLFNLIAEMPLQPGRVSRTISGKTGQTMFFYYWPHMITVNGRSAIAGGCMLIMSGSEISQNLVWADALKHGNPAFRRSYDRVVQPETAQGLMNRSIVSGFRESEEGFQLVQTASQVSITDLILRGRFRPIGFADIAGKMPVLKLTAPLESMQHPLVPWMPQINLVCRILVLVAGVLLLHIYFFGLEFKAGISVKVLVGTSVVLVLPILLLLTGFVSLNRFNSVSSWYKREEKHQRIMERFRSGLTAYINRLQFSALNLSMQIEDLTKRMTDDDEIRSMLAVWLSESVASDIYLDRVSGNILHLRSDRFARSLDKDEESVRRLTASAIVHAFNEDGDFNDAFVDGRNRRIDSMDAGFVNEMMHRTGRPVRMFTFQNGNRYLTFFIKNKDRFSPHGLLNIRIHESDLLRDFIQHEFLSTSGINEFQTKFYLVDSSDGLNRFVDILDGTEVKSSELLHHLEQAANSDSLTVREKGGSSLFLCWLGDYPLALAIRSPGLTITASETYIAYLMPAYAFMLLLFMFVFLKMVYLRPVAEFVEITEKVAAGDYLLQIRKTCSDEFGELQQTFAEMIRGLEQKRQMSRFVSQDVISAVESSDESMAPGGEKIDAAVVFIQLTDLNPAGDNGDAEDLFKRLSSFITAADHFAAVNGGVIDKIIENTLMLVFRSGRSADSNRSACRAALALSEEMRRQGFSVRCGIASGTVVSGRIGSRLGKLDFTVIGDPVNLAARLKAQAVKAGETGIIIAPSTIRALKGSARVTFLDRCEIKGKSREYPLYELTALRS